MTLGSWIYMLTLRAFILAVNVFCFRRIFSKKRAPEQEVLENSRTTSQDD